MDVVLETRERIFIGEAKFESGFQPKSSHVLVHQLIRQYVTASILVHLAGRSGKRVVSFVVTGEGNVESIKNTAQVRFMNAQPSPADWDAVWLPEDNVLSWGQVNDIRIDCR